MKWRPAGQGAATVLNCATQGNVVCVAALSRVVRRGDDVRQVEKWLIDAELAVAYRFNPPGIDAGGKARVPEQVIIQRPFLHDLPTGQVDQIAPPSCGRARRRRSGRRSTGERRADQQNAAASGRHSTAQAFRSNPPAIVRPCRLMACTRMRMPYISRAVSGSDAAKAEDTADPAREHAILRVN